MHQITAFALERSRLTILLMVGLFAAGLLIYADFPKREDPEITIRTAKVTIDFEGMSPERMENLIADPVERKIREIPEVDDIDALIVTGRTIVDVTIQDKYSNLDPIWQELRDKMEEVSRELPTDTQGPFVNTNIGDVSIASIAMTAEGFSFREMEEAAKNLQRMLYTLEGVANVKLYGVQAETIWLEFDTKRLATVGVQIERLISDLQEQNVVLPAGQLNADGLSILLEASGEFQSVDEISEMLTRVDSSGDFVRLGDLVKLRRGLVSPKDKPVYYNGRPAIVVSVEMQSYFDIAALGDSIQRVTRQYEQTLPIGYALEFATFQPKEVSSAVNSAMTNVAQTITIVLLVMIMFLGLRSGMVIASIVPAAIMLALIGMRVLSLNLEQVSIAAIIISLGLLVDNGVVVVEDILRRINIGESSREAALNAGGQFSMPLLISSLTTIFAFIPFFLMQGNSGEYAFSLGAVVALTLFGSWFSAIYFLPFIASIALTKRGVPVSVDLANSGQHNASTAPIESPRRKAFGFCFRLVLRNGMKHPVVFIALCYAGVIFAAMLMTRVPAEMFPLSDRAQILIYQEMPRGTDISATEKTVLDISRWLSNEQINPEVANHVAYIGSGGPRFYLALSPSESEPENAFILVNTHNFEQALAFSNKAQRYLTEQQPEARFKIKRLSMGPGDSGIVDIKISGSNADRLLELAKKVETGFRQLPHMSINENDWGSNRLKLIVAVDQDKARRAGISSKSMTRLLSAYFDGYPISDYREQSQSIPIVLRAMQHNRDSAEDLLNISIGSNGETIAMEQIANIEPALEYSRIRRSNQVRTIRVTAKSDTLTAGQLASAIQPTLDKLDLSGGYNISFGGELEDSSETYGALAKGLPIAFILMLAAIVFQFNSLRRTMIVFMSVPLVLVGVPLGLLLLHQPLSFFGNLGLLSLAGIIINNAIVLIDQIDIERSRLALHDAISVAAEKRLRPIMLTSATTVVGLLPLYLFGSSMWTPLAVVMMSGLAVASILTLVFVPASYALLFRSEQ